MIVHLEYNVGVGINLTHENRKQVVKNIFLQFEDETEIILMANIEDIEDVFGEMRLKSKS